MPVGWDAESVCASGKESEPPTTRWVKATAHCWDSPVWQSDGRKDTLALARSTPKHEYRAAVSSAQGFPILLFAGRRNDVTRNLTGSRQRTYPVLQLPGRMRRNELSHRLAKTRYQNRFPGLADSLEHGEAGGFEFGNRNFFHVEYPTSIVLWSETMVNA